jgi:NADH:ubiquinone oxidoreductase subunit
MVWGVIQNVRQGLKNRGGWKGLLEHMYTNGDYPFKIGTFMGADAAGNRYYENRVDYPFGQHRWVEPGDIHNFDSSSIAPEWQGWMVSMNDTPPHQEDEFIEEAMKHVPALDSQADAPDATHVGHQETMFHFHHMHNQSQVRSRGYGIGNPIVGLPPHAKHAYYTQPGSPYNDAFVRPNTPIGSLDADGGRTYKSEKWADRLRTPAEKQAILDQQMAQGQAAMDRAKKHLSMTKKQRAMMARGAASVVGK